MTASEWLLIVLGGVLLIEILSGRHKGVYKRQDILVTAAALAVTRVITSPILAVFTAAALTWLLPSFKGVLSDTPIVPSVIAMIIIGEFCLYWVHRWAHDPVNHPLLYGMHRTHHAASYLNITVMARINLFWPIVQPYGWVSGIAIYLGLVEASAIFFLLLLAWNAFTHSDLCWDNFIVKHVKYGENIVRTIELFFVTPRLHHTHHGYGKNGKGFRNYCTMLTGFDRLFGTLFTPDGRPANYGILGRDRSWQEQLFFPLIKDKPQQLKPAKR